MTATAAEQMLTQKVTVTRVAHIHPNPGNIREDLGDLTELAASIRAHGILQPLIVEPHPDKPGQYRLLAGHRRLAAAKRAHVQAVPVIVRRSVSDDVAIELMLVENCQRRNLGAMETAEALEALRNRGYTVTQIARNTGMAQGRVSYFLALLDLDDKAREKVRSGDLRASHAVTAVRQVRKQQRRQRGSTATYAWEPDWLSADHPLAARAARLCDEREHGMRRRIGKTACGQCWETVIRDDEREVTR